MTGRCIGLSCLKKWDNDDKVGRFGRCRPSCLEPQCTNLGALRLFACPCVVLMSRSLLRGTASTVVPTKNCQPFRRLAHLSKATIRRKTRWAKVGFYGSDGRIFGLTSTVTTVTWGQRLKKLPRKGGRVFSDISKVAFRLVCSFAHKFRDAFR